MRKKTTGLACAALAFFLAACGGGDGGGSGGPGGGGTGNTAPTANAGANQTVSSGVTVTLNGAASTDPDGSIASYAWTQTGGTPIVILSNAATVGPTFAAPQVNANTTLTFSLIVRDNIGASSAASQVTITVTPATQGTTNVTGQITFRRVLIAASGNRGLQYDSPAAQPARGVTVKALDAGNPLLVLATTVTDSTGNYSLAVSGNTNITLQIVARMTRAATPTWDVRVQDGVTAANPYSYSDGPFNSNVGTRDVDIPTGISAAGTAAGARPSGPFAILDTIYQALQTVTTADPSVTTFPALIVDWGSQTAGTFFTTAPAQHIALLADLSEDTDEFDQHVIAHEFGHYLEQNFSRADNIGGSHALGDRLDPRVAFGEGWGYAFAAMALNSTDSRDTFVVAGVQRSGGFNIETNPATNAPGAGGDREGCWCSESSVWSILYDVYDNAADNNDSVALGFAPIWSVLKGAQKTTNSFTTIFSFVTALKASGTGQNAAIDTLVGAQNITATGIDAFASTETHSPTTITDRGLPIFTTIAVGTPVTLKSTDDEGLYNQLGDQRFLKFVAPSTRAFTITLTTSNPNAAADPDFFVFRNGVAELSANSAPGTPAATQTGVLDATSGQTYIIDAFDCGNGCSPAEGTSGDYDLTVSIN